MSLIDLKELRNSIDNQIEHPQVDCRVYQNLETVDYNPRKESSIFSVQGIDLSFPISVLANYAKIFPLNGGSKDHQFWMSYPQFEEVIWEYLQAEKNLEIGTWKEYLATDFADGQQRNKRNPSIQQEVLGKMKSGEPITFQEMDAVDFYFTRHSIRSKVHSIRSLLTNNLTRMGKITYEPIIPGYPRIVKLHPGYIRE